MNIAAPHPSRSSAISVNRSAAPLVAALIARADALGLAVSTGAAGETLVDAGAAVTGSLEAGRLLTEICLGGLGSVAIGTDAALPNYPFNLTVQTPNPVLACLGSQYAGWMLTSGEGDNSYFSMGSGPARALAGKDRKSVV